MEILYLYIKDYGQLKNKQFNFGGQFRFHYEVETGTLDVSENPNYLTGFFDNVSNIEVANISNVTAIVGENGVGKSTFLSLVKDCFSRGNADIRREIIVALINDDSERVVYHLSSLPIRRGNYAQFGFESRELKITYRRIKPSNLTFDVTEYPSIDEFWNTDFINFSNVFDGKLEFELEGLYDISTNFLVRNDHVKKIETGVLFDKEVQSTVDVYRFEDIERQIAFINGFDSKKVVPFTLPELLLITAKRRFLDFEDPFTPNEKEFLEGYGLLNLAKKILDKARTESETSREDIDKVESYFIASALVNFILEVSINYHSVASFGYLKPPEKINWRVNLKEIALKILNDFLQQANKFKRSLDQSIASWVEDIKRFNEALPRFINKEYIGNSAGSSFALNIGTSEESFRSFYAIYKNTFKLRPYLNFSWRDISTGEKALLNIYSRFYSLKNEEVVGENAKLKKNVVVLIDEGDAYLHPAWQRKFLKILIDFLPIIYHQTPEGERRKLQIVFTTNSPIPVSDLPNSNIIFLKRRNGDVEVQDSLEDKKMTFGANIHTLLSDSFFMEEGMIGDFAVEKINYVIDILLNKKEIVFEKKDELEVIINMIGEPVIKSKLIQMLTDKMALATLDLDQRLKKVEDFVNRSTKK